MLWKRMRRRSRFWRWELRFEKGYLVHISSIGVQEQADPHAEAFAKIRTVLSGELSIKLKLEFLLRNNHTDLLILKNTKVGFGHPDSKKGCAPDGPYS